MINRITIPEIGLVVVNVKGGDYQYKKAIVDALNQAAVGGPMFTLCDIAVSQLTPEQLKHAEQSS